MDVRELIRSMEGSFHEFNQLFSKINPLEINKRSPGSSDRLKDLLHTLVDIEDEVIQFRLKKILFEEHPYLPRIDIDKFKQKPHQEDSIDQIIEVFLLHRQKLIKLLHSLPSDKWERTGVHETEGHVSFKELVRRMAEKDRRFLSELKAALSKS